MAVLGSEQGLVTDHFLPLRLDAAAFLLNFQLVGARALRLRTRDAAGSPRNILASSTSIDSDLDRPIRRVTLLSYDIMT